MANHKSAEKRIRRNGRREDINRMRVSRLRTFVKRVELALDAGNATDARAAFQEAVPHLQIAASKGLLHKNTSSRKISRLSARVKLLEGHA